MTTQPCQTQMSVDDLRVAVLEHADEAASWLDPDDRDGHQALTRMHDEATTLAERLTAVAALHHGPRTERHGSGCIHCGIVWPCPTALAVEGAQ